MKNLSILFATLLIVGVASCSKSKVESRIMTDSTQVDTLVVDTFSVDSLCIDSLITECAVEDTVTVDTLGE